MPNLIPAPASLQRLEGDPHHGEPPHGELTGSGAPESYALEVTSDRVTLTAPDEAGLFYGRRTLEQLRGPDGSMPPVRIEDAPRFAHRGVMLDVARHFFGVADVKRFIDLAAGYKLNVLHLHLTDDQGWRLESPKWPRLTSTGATTQIGGGPGGFYTRQDYAEIVRYAGERFMTVIPELDVPGHTNAALLAYPELGPDGVAPPPETGIHSPGRSLNVGDPAVLRFLDDVVGELAQITPGPYIHLGADEVEGMTDDDYRAFIHAAAEIVSRHGKRMIGWEEMAAVELPPGVIVQFWTDPKLRDAAVRQGAPLIMSPAPHTYLDQKYDASTELGLSWAGNVDVRDAYEWEPGDDALGVEAALWTETVEDFGAIAYMTLPRLPAVAEVAWSARRDWEDFKLRLAAHGPQWEALGLNFHRSPQVPWTAS
ncbi:beta-N-acetylhexosaminidase [Candidatus Solirubrobacter pratensis]|uniref:beta-N-acetylhexosaminidase n=1 Tax=Candidatus Solirubrobacter pratensis TaxID=1298857 RepID=UPI000408FF4A|nr:family 20 glycosylhydrolase [Candidatus Solirubrobacter pratensis]